MPSCWLEQRKARGGRVWVVKWATTQGGRRFTGSKSLGPFKATAEAFKARKLEELFSNKAGVAYHRDDATWREFADAYLEHCRKHKAPRTLRNFDARAMALAGQWFGARGPSDISAQDVAAWETDLLTRFNPTTTGMWMRCFRTALRWGKDHGFVRDVPKMTMPKAESPGRVLSDAEVAALLAALPERVRPGIVFVLHTGLRRGELLSLRWERVARLADGAVVAEIGGVGGPTTKTGRSRAIDLPPAAVEAMGAQRHSGPVYAVANESWSHRVREAAESAGLGRVRFHDLRHTWATKYMIATGDLFGLMRAGGWSTMGSVRVYQHLTRARAAAANLVRYTLSTPEEKLEIDGKHD